MAIDPLHSIVASNTFRNKNMYCVIGRCENQAGVNSLNNLLLWTRVRYSPRERERENEREKANEL